MFRKPFDAVFRREEFSASDVDRMMSAKPGSPGALDNSGAAGAAATPPPGTGPAAGAAPGAGAQPPAGSAAGAAAGAGAAPTEPIHIDIRSLGFKSKDEFDQRFNQIPTLEKNLLEAKAQPKFKSERAKWLYDYANQVDGMELPRARQILDLASTPLDKLPDQQARFEAFKLKPEHKGLGHDDLMTLFADHEDKQFGPPLEAADPVNAQKIKARELRIKIATDQSRGDLQKILSEYEATRPVELTPEQLIAERQDYETKMLEELTTTKFDGLEFALSFQGEDGKSMVEGKVNYKLDPAQMKDVASAIANPDRLWATLMEKAGAIKDGRPVADKFAGLLMNLMYADKIRNEIYKQGRNDERVAALKTGRNPGSQHNSGGAPAGGGGGADKDEMLMAGEAALKTVSSR